MYQNKITLFNRYVSPLGGEFWYSKVISGVDLIIDKAALTARYGTDTQDKVKMHVKYIGSPEEDIYIGGYKYYTPKKWDNLTNDEIAKSITFKSGQNFDFFVDGEFNIDNPINDDDYKDGFYNYMNKKYDNVFVISSVSSPYTLIKHFEIIGK